MMLLMEKGHVVTYQELLPVGTGTSTEPLIDARTYDPEIVTKYEKPDMRAYSGDRILVRDTVARKLAAVNGHLRQEHGMLLRIAYGYRHPDVQKRYFDAIKEKLVMSHPDAGDAERAALAHNFVAVPEVAGHPTGGAVDLTCITASGVAVDMGTGIADYADPARIPTYAEGLTQEQARNRSMLHDAMTAEGFVPFYGEWWHFSYGDKEWAYASGEPSAIYGPMTIERIEKE
jgi:D-alanyl-D-alanine dipeptidase